MPWRPTVPEDGGVPAVAPPDAALVDLDEPAALDPAVVGAKAARLAAARRLGLPALPGVVVPMAAARPVRETAVQALADGSGAARLAVMRATVDAGLTDRLRARAAEFGYPVVARSSSPLDDDPRWAGAFSSLLDVHAEDLATAVRGCWGSAYAVDPLERAAQTGVAVADLAVAVLVQPQVVPDVSGLARASDGDAVVLTAVKGPPAPLLSGWERGTSITVAAGDAVHVAGSGAAPMTDADAVAVAELARTVRARLDADVIEWALCGGRVVLLQARRAAPPADSASPPTPSGLEHPVALRLARLAATYTGADADVLVLSWACAPGWDTADDAVAPPRGGAGAVGDGAAARMRQLAERLVAHAWGLPAPEALDAARATLAAARGAEPAAALDRLARLEPVPAGPAARLLSMVRAATGPHGGGGVARTGWEPFVYGAVRAHGRRLTGVPAAPGTGVGLVAPVTNPHVTTVRGDRPVLAAPWPLPGLAPLLWGAAGLVTGTGSPAAHLLEVAHSLHVPAVVGCPVDRWLDHGDGAAWIAAVDGGTGEVHLTSAATGAHT